MRVAFVLKGYPRLSETFIAQEIAALEKRGLDILIVSLRRPTDGATHPVHREIKAPVLYLPEYLLLEPIRVFRSLLKARNLGSAVRVWLKDLLRDPTPNRVRRLGQAAVLAAEAPQDITRLHAATHEVLETAIRYEGSTLGDGTYRNALNQNGQYQNAHRVYDRAGDVCPTCREGIVQRIVQAQRSMFYCPICQPRSRSRGKRRQSRGS